MQEKRFLKVNKDESGQALSELSLVLPLLVFLSFAVIDVGKLLNQYIIMTQIVREGASIAASLTNLENVDYAAAVSLDENNSPNQWLVQSRMEYLLSLEKNESRISYIDNSVSITTEFFNAASQVDTLDELNTVRVTLTAEYTSSLPIVSLFPGLPISVTETSPYLR